MLKLKKGIIVLFIFTMITSMISSCTKTKEKNITLKIGIPNGTSLMPYSILEGFKKANPHITVEVDEAPWSDFSKKLTMQIAAGNPSDVFVTDSGYAASLGGMGAAMDLSDRIKKDLVETQYTNALYAGRNNEGNVWGIPQAMNSIGILYNKKLFDQEGVAYPNENWTFEDMFNIAKKFVKDTNHDGETDIYGFTSGFNITQGWLPFMLSTGGAPLDESRQKATFNTKESIEGLKKFREPLDTGIAPSISWLAANGYNTSAFYMGKVAMILAQSGDVVAINDNAPKDFEFDAQIMPLGWNQKRNCVYVPNQWVVYSKASKEVQDAAWEWIKYFLNENSQKAMIDELKTKPIVINKNAMKYLEEQQTVPKNLKAFYEGIDKYGVTLFENPTWRNWRGEIDKIAADIYNGVVTATDGAEKMNEIAQKIIDEGV